MDPFFFQETIDINKNNNSFLKNDLKNLINVII